MMDAKVLCGLSGGRGERSEEEARLEVSDEVAGTCAENGASYLGLGEPGALCGEVGGGVEVMRGGGVADAQVRASWVGNSGVRIWGGVPGLWKAF